MKRSSVLLAGAACLAFILPAGAQTVSQEQAWNQCLKEIDQTVGAKTDNNDVQRAAAFKACMAKLGHKGGN